MTCIRHGTNFMKSHSVIAFTALVPLSLVIVTGHSGVHLISQWRSRLFITFLIASAVCRPETRFRSRSVCLIFHDCSVSSTKRIVKLWKEILLREVQVSVVIETPPFSEAALYYSMTAAFTASYAAGIPHFLNQLAHGILYLQKYS
jgi:hypothetical protein